MLTLLLAALAMALKDAISTLLVVAEARGRPVLAGAADAMNDIATAVVTVYGAGVAIRDGWTAHTFAVLGVMMVASFFGTILWTKLSQRIASGVPIRGGPK